MMKFKGTIFFALIVAAIGVFAVLEFQKSTVEEETKATKDNIVLNLKPSDVASLSFKDKDQAFLLKRDGQKWRVLEPVLDNADDQAIDSTLSELFSQNVEVLAEDGEKLDPAKYGFGSNLAEYNLEFIDGQKLKVEISGTRTYDKAYYVQKNSDGIILVGGTGWDSLLTKKTENFRSKKINLEDGQLTSLHISSKVTGHVSDTEFKRVDGQWVYSKDKSIKLDETKISEYFNKFHLLRADGILADKSDKNELKKNKFIRPELVVELKTEASPEKSQAAKIEFKILEDGSALMVASVNQPIYKIPKAKVNDFAQGLVYFRDKKFPFAFDPLQSSNIEIKKISDPLALNIKKEGEIWADVKSSEVKIKQPEVKKLLEGLSKLEAKEFVGKVSSKAKKSNSVLIKDAEGKVTFSLSYLENKTGDAYQAVTNLSDEAVLVSKASLDNLLNNNLIEASAPIHDEKSK